MCAKWLIRGPAPWPPDRFTQAVAANISIGGVLSQLGCGVSGTNYRRVHNMVRDLQLDTSHWLGMGFLRGKTHTWSPSKSLSEILVERSTYHNLLQLKKRLVQAGCLQYACALCGISDWQGRILVLQLDHVNGVGDDHRLENLRLLCPNCHSQTNTYCGRNARRAIAMRSGAEGGTRTPTGLPPPHFECGAAAITPPRPENAWILTATAARRSSRGDLA
jgi:hypothetical protein